MGHLAFVTGHFSVFIFKGRHFSNQLLVQVTLILEHFHTEGGLVCIYKSLILIKQAPKVQPMMMAVHMNLELWSKSFVFVDGSLLLKTADTPDCPTV